MSEQNADQQAAQQPGEGASESMPSPSEADEGLKTHPAHGTPDEIQED
jgi:hypothetical protein